MPYDSTLRLVVDSSGAENNLRRFRGELDQTEQSGASAGRSLKGVATAVSALGVAVAGLALREVINETAKFEDSMLGLQAVSKATAQQMQQLEKQARTLGATSMFSAKQAGDAQRYLAQAGFEVNEILSATPGLLNLAAAGQMDLARAADIASNVLGGMRLEVDQLNRVNDVLAATASGANTNIEQLGEALSYAAPFAAAAGISLEDTAAAIGAMSDAGIQASRAGTGLVGIIRQLSNITPAAQEALEAAGVSLESVNIQARGLQPVLDTLSKASLDVGQSIEIFGSEAGSAALNVIEASDKIEGFSKSLGNAEGAAERMALVIGSGLTGSMRSFNSMVSESTLQLGDSGIADAFKQVTDTATGVLAIYNRMLPAFAEANDLSESQVDRLKLLANGLESLGKATAGVAAIYGVRLATAFAASTAAMAKNTFASVAAAKADASAAQATVRRTGAEVQAAKAILSTARIDAQATVGTNAHAFALQQVSAARIRATEAAGAHNAALAAETAAMGRASIAARGLSGALGLLGGPVGAAIVAGGAIYYFREQLGLVPKPARTVSEELDTLRLRLNDVSEATIKYSVASFTAELFQLQVQAQQASERLETLKEAQNSSSSFGQGMRGDLSAGIREQEVELEGLNNKIESRKQAVEQLMQKMAELNTTASDGASIFRTLDDWMFPVVETMAAGGDEADKFAKSISGLLDELYPLQKMQREYADQKAMLTRYAREEGLSNEWLNETLSRLDDSYRNASDAAEVYNFTGQKAAKDVQEAFDPALKAMERGVERLDDSFADAWRSMLDGSKDAFSSLKDIALDTLAEIIHAYTTRRITASLGMTLAGTGAAAAGQSASSLGGIGDVGDLVSMGSSLYNGGLQAAGNAYRGGMLGNAVFGGGGYSNTGAALGAAAGQVLIPIPGVGAAIGSFLGSGLGSLFGGSGVDPNLVFKTEGKYGTAGRSGFEREISAQSALGQVGFARESRDLDYAFDSFDEAQQYIDGVAQLDNTFAAIADSADQLAAIQQTVQTKGLLDRSGSEFLTDRYRSGFATLGNSFQSVFDSFDGTPDKLVSLAVALDSLDDTITGNATAMADAQDALGSSDDVLATAQAMAQQAQAMGTLDSAASQLNLRFDATAQGALDAAGNLAELVGGIDNLNALNSQYYQAFYTDAEKFDRLSSSLSEAFDEMGRDLPTTREGVRSLVEGLDLMTESGREQYAQIMQLVPSLQQYTGTLSEQQQAAEQAAEAIASQRWDLQNKLLEAQGKDTELLNRQRERELEGLDESNRALQKRIWALQDEEKAQEAAAQAAQEAAEEAARRASLITGANIYGSGLIGNVSDALGSFNDASSTLDDIAQTRQAQLSDEYRAIESLSDLIDSLSVSELATGSRLDAARQQYNELYQQAMGGDAEAAQQLGDAAQTYLDLQKQSSSTAQEYARVYGQVTNGVVGLQGQFEESVDQLDDVARYNDRQLREQERTNHTLLDSLTQLVDSNSSLQSIADLIDILPSDLASQLSDIFPEYGSDVGQSAFNEAAYLANKTAQVNANNQGGRSDWTVGEVYDRIMQDFGSVYAHYQQYGRDEGVLPGFGDSSSPGSASNADRFNESKYLSNYLDYLNQRDSGERDWSRMEMLDAFSDANLTPYEHWMRYGRSEGVKAYATGAWKLDSDQLAYVHKDEMVVPSRNGIADEFRAYASGNSYGELLKEVKQLRSDLAASQRAIAENTRKSARVLERYDLRQRQEEFA
ncbi:phage tail tape measure protein [Modicisalibacter coralii]|uniref:phage tail tape measure protein n=1 Tax=Modicisalibacter coralii TaxID=2304602 RepID=UPI00100B5C56|nr:phage tail tape measure protein [Halomonas coralii]